MDSPLEKKIWDSMNKAYMTWVLVLGIVCMYLWSSSSDWVWGASVTELLRSGALSARKIDQGEIWRLGMSLVLHGDLLHLGMNMLALLALGRMAESIFGKVRCFSILYLSGMGGALLSWSMGAQRTVGASGAIFGLLATMSVFGWKYRDELTGELGSLLRRKLLFWGVVNLVLGFVIPNIDNPSHIGGFVCGGLLGTMISHQWERGWERLILASVTIGGIWLSILSY